MLAALRASSECTLTPRLTCASCPTVPQPFITARVRPASARACPFRHAPEHAGAAAHLEAVAVAGPVAVCSPCSCTCTEAAPWAPVHHGGLSSASGLWCLSPPKGIPLPNAALPRVTIPVFASILPRFHLGMGTFLHFVLPPSHGKGAAISPASEPIRAQDRRRCFRSPSGSRRRINAGKLAGTLCSGEGAGSRGAGRRPRLQPAGHAVLRRGGGREGSQRGTQGSPSEPALCSGVIAPAPRPRRVGRRGSSLGLWDDSMYVFHKNH